MINFWNRLNVTTRQVAGDLSEVVRGANMDEKQRPLSGVLTRRPSWTKAQSFGEASKNDLTTEKCRASMARHLFWRKAVYLGWKMLYSTPMLNP